MKISIHLPVTPAIKKYLTVRVGENYTVRFEDWFGGIVLSVLENTGSKHGQLVNKRENTATEEFTFTISLSYAEKNGFIILPKHEVLINNIIEDIFRKEMYIQALINKKCYKIEYHTTFSNIMDVYDITDDDLTMDAVKKEFIRKRADIEKSLFL